MAETLDQEKRAAAESAAQLVRDGMVVGLGTGSTADHAIRVLGERVAAGLRITGVPTSRRSEQLARACGVPLTDLQAVSGIDLTIDGADEIERSSLAVLKGRGGALVREKLVAVASACVVIVADATKLVEQLGVRYPVPVEVLPFGWRVPAQRLAALGGSATLRLTGAEADPFVTDNGNYILDVAFGPIEDPAGLGQSIKSLTGVVDHGLFVDIVDRVFLAEADRIQEFVASRRP